MYEKILTEIGLTKSEIAVYLALLNLESSTTWPIIKKAKIAAGKAYLILDKLIQKGLATYIIKSGSKYYQAKDPERLVDYLKEKENELKEKENELKKILPSLKEKYKRQKQEQFAEIFEGDKGLKTFYESMLRELKKGDTIYILGVGNTLNQLEKYDEYFMDWNKRRISLGINMKILYNHDAKKIGEKREKMKFTEVKYMDKKIETPVWVDIFGDYVATINIHENPILFIIKDKNSAESYKKYFNSLWNLSKK